MCLDVPIDVGLDVAMPVATGTATELVLALWAAAAALMDADEALPVIHT